MPEIKEDVRITCRKCEKGMMIRVKDVKIGDKLYYTPASLIIYQCTQPGCEFYFIQIGVDLIAVDELQLLHMIAEVREDEVKELEAKAKELEIGKGEIFKAIWGVPEYFINPEDPTKWWIKRARESGQFIPWLRRHMNWAKTNINKLTEEEKKAINLE